MHSNIWAGGGGRYLLMGVDLATGRCCFCRQTWRIRFLPLTPAVNCAFVYRLVTLCRHLFACVRLICCVYSRGLRLVSLRPEVHSDGVMDEWSSDLVVLLMSEICERVNGKHKCSKL